MRNLFVGILLPLLLVALPIWSRIQWDEDIHPLEISWWFWVLTLCLGSWFGGVGFRAYWWPGGHRRHFRD